jgi:hypothetical protein
MPKNKKETEGKEYEQSNVSKAIQVTTAINDNYLKSKTEKIKTIHWTNWKL